MASRQPLAWLAPVAISVVLLSLLAVGLTGPRGDFLQDFVEYWSAGRLIAQGENPYDPGKLAELQYPERPALPEPTMMWNPPWTLTLVMPFGLLPCRAAYVLWLALNLFLLVACPLWIWRLYEGPPAHRWLALAIAFAYLPTFFVLRTNQIGPQILLGLAGFLFFERRQLGVLAGASAILAASKPQLVYLFGLALLIWALDRRRWSVLVGGGATLLVLIAVPLALNPHVFEQYRDALANYPPRFFTATVGTYLRLGFGVAEDPRWFKLQYLPMLPGICWLIFYYLKNRRAWDWPNQVPILILVSFLTAAYGGWYFDFVIFLLPVLQAAIWTLADGRRLTLIHALTGFLIVEVLVLLLAWDLWYLWLTPVVLYYYLSLSKPRSVPADAKVPELNWQTS
jgi:hypothetical protein